MIRPSFLPEGVNITPPRARELVLETLRAETAKILSHKLHNDSSEPPTYEITLIADGKNYHCLISAESGKIIDISRHAA